MFFCQDAPVQKLALVLWGHNHLSLLPRMKQKIIVSGAGDVGDDFFALLSIKII